MIERASGVHMWDVDGNEYIDASSGPMVSAIGHGNNEVIDAMADQARNARNFCAARMPR
ncbi:MAG: aminotransferase class III-fold pyridoxal phosphate-dependent enzyme [Alphaproteobacteria bacterium]|nr:aminotransferase class III-fold pyridoxal phosphate-dependent enzyme [Alphaproteobacteria bacterium]